MANPDLTTLRWTIACAVLAAVARGAGRREWRELLPHWRRVVLMGACGFTAYASLFYLAGTYTSALNLAPFQGAIPVLVILLNLVATRARTTAGQLAGVAVTLIGASVAASHGDWSVLRTLSFNVGDGLMLAACMFYASYTVALPARPKVSALTFFSAMAAAALLTSLPLLWIEWVSGRLIWPTAKGWAVVTFVALGPSLAAQLAFMRGVEMIGPNRAGLFVNLVPVFGVLLAVVLVGEPFGIGEGLALVLVLSGIAVVETSARMERKRRGPARHA